MKLKKTIYGTHDIPENDKDLLIMYKRRSNTILKIPPIDNLSYDKVCGFYSFCDDILLRNFRKNLTPFSNSVVAWDLNNWDDLTNFEAAHFALHKASEYGVSNKRLNTIIEIIAACTARIVRTSTLPAIGKIRDAAMNKNIDEIKEYLKGL